MFIGENLLFLFFTANFNLKNIGEPLEVSRRELTLMVPRKVI